MQQGTQSQTPLKLYETSLLIPISFESGYLPNAIIRISPYHYKWAISIGVLPAVFFFFNLFSVRLKQFFSSIAGKKLEDWPTGALGDWHCHLSKGPNSCSNLSSHIQCQAGYSLQVSWENILTSQKCNKVICVTTG